MTARAIVGDREECMRHGMDDYITKPVHRPILQACLRRWLRYNECTEVIGPPPAIGGLTRRASSCTRLDMPVPDRLRDQSIGTPRSLDQIPD